MRRPIVLHVGTRLDTKGGVASVERMILQAGVPGYRVAHVATHRDGGALATARQFLAGFAAIGASAVRRRHCLYHIHLSTHGSTLRKAAIVLVLRLFRRHVILHSHGSRFEHFYHQQLGRVGRAAFRAAFGRANGIIVLSPEWRAFFTPILPTVPALELPNAVPLPDPPIAPKSAVPKSDLANAPFRIASLGRIGERKGSFDLITAVSLLRGRGHAIALHLAGDGDHSRAKALAAELGIADALTIHAWLDEAGRDALLRAVDAFALPSFAEGLPMALLEAMSYALPVVTTPVGGIPSLIRDGENGILTPPGDPAALADALERLIAAPEQCQRLGEAAFSTIAATYSSDRYVSRLAELYEAILADPIRIEPGRAEPSL